jgi:Mlc titration factor MtfA (ptsG expression regulator)
MGRRSFGDAREKHPQLYSQLQQFYRQDPAALGKG